MKQIKLSIMMILSMLLLVSCAGKNEVLNTNGH